MPGNTMYCDRLLIAHICDTTYEYGSLIADSCHKRRSRIGMGNILIIVIIVTVNCHDNHYRLISKHHDNCIITIITQSHNIMRYIGIEMV